MKLRIEFNGARWWPALACAAAAAVAFQCFGNATHGYIDSNSLFYWWGHQWFNAESETEHGLIIFPLAVWILIRNLRAARGDSEEGKEAGSWKTEYGAAVAAMVAGLAIHVVGYAAQQTRLSIVGLLVFTWGVLRLGGGSRWGRAAVFPLAFMVFAIPVNALDSVGFWLRLWVIKASSALAHLAGIDVVQNGTQLMSPEGRYQYDVAAACSGVRSLMALLALSLLMGYISFRSWGRRLGLFLLCFPLIYLGNVARISSIIFVAQWRGQVWGERAHDVMGYGVFAIVLGGLMGAARLMEAALPPEEPGVGGREQERREERRAGGKGPRGIWWAAGGVMAAAVGVTVFLGHLASLPPRGQVGVRLAADGRDPVELPSFLGTEWIGRRSEVTAVEREILPPDTGYARKDYVAVANPARRVFLSVVLSGRDRTSIHRPELCLVGQGWTIRESVDGHFSDPTRPRTDFPVTLLRVRRQVRTNRGVIEIPQIVAYWFIGGDTVVGSHWKRLVVDAWNRVVHARADRWAYVLVQTDAQDGEAAAVARIQDVLDQTLPAVIAAKPRP